MESIKNVIDVDGVKHDTLYAFLQLRVMSQIVIIQNYLTYYLKNIVSLAFTRT